MPWALRSVKVRSNKFQYHLFKHSQRCRIRNVQIKFTPFNNKWREKQIFKNCFWLWKGTLLFLLLFFYQAVYIFTNDIKNKKIWLKLYKIKLNNTSKEPYKKQQAFKRINKAAKNKRSDKTIIKMIGKTNVIMFYQSQIYMVFDHNNLCNCVT